MPSPQIAEGDAFVASVWQRIRDRLQLNLRGSGGLEMAQAVSAAELASLQAILDEEIPKLRRLAAPLDYANMVREGYNQTIG